MIRKTPEQTALEREKVKSLYLAIGQFMFEFSQLEFTIRHLLGEILEFKDTGPDALFDILISPYDFATLCNVTKAVFMRVVRCEQSDRDEIESIMNAALSLNSEDRLPIAHGTWFIGNEGHGARHVSRGKLEMKIRYPKIADIDAAAQTAATLRTRVVKFIRGTIPPLPEAD
jgi:hypothetical protein